MYSSIKRIAKPFALCALGAMAATLCPSAIAGGYSITDLGSLPGYTYSWEWQQTINNNGLVAAYANNTDDPNAYSGDASYLSLYGSVAALPGLPGSVDTIAFGLNDLGDVVGRSTLPGAANSPVLWSHGSVQALAELPGDDKGSALMINDAGESVGYSENTTTGVRRATTWFHGWVAQLPPLPTGGVYDDALGINRLGQIAGWSGASNGTEQIALWENGTVTDIGSIAGGTAGSGWGDAYSINDAGEIVGISGNSNVAADAFLYSNGVVSDLGLYGADVVTVGLSINNAGTAVGCGFPNYVTDIPDHALMWKDGQTINLQTKIPASSGYTLIAASGINDRGQIDAMATKNGQERNVVLTPH